MILFEQCFEPAEEEITLLLGEVVDMADVLSYSEQRLPTRHGVRANNRVDGTEDTPDILGRSARSFVDFETVASGGLVEMRLLKRAGEGFQELLDGSGDSVVEFVAGGPESVCCKSVSHVHRFVNAEER